jgi:hypothetical protein
MACIDVEDILQRLTPFEKVELLAGRATRLPLDRDPCFSNLMLLLQVVLAC